ncbi:hypothetical protein L6452_29176 [Arctium lappa]|uniref:Uncharacterized protein n=1 Tax=Arctium lappa TaxID=4217 RepID=A0ACB8ZFV8_ARCLA|nr:hypothetical protein L6452_29176 [Arctium lappa]
MGFRQCSQYTIPTSFSDQISLSGEVITLQDCKQHGTEIKEHAFDKGILRQRKIFIKTHDLEKFFVERLDDSQVKIISKLLQSCQEVDYDKQEIVQIRGLNNHLMDRRNFHSSCKLERFKMTSEVSSPTLVTLASGFFNYTLERDEHILDKYANIKAKHLLDLLRLTFLPPELEHSMKPDSRPPSHIIHTISKLRRAGIKLKPWKADSFLVVKFKYGVIHMPTITIDDFMSTFLLNSVAFKQCRSGCSKHFTTYVTLLDSLINTTKDVGYLCDSNIIENYLGTETDVATLIY